jgi:hypothetical protein
VVARAVVFVFCLFGTGIAGCASPPDPAALVKANMARMAAAKGFSAKHRIAQQSCRAAGLETGTRHYAGCVDTYHALDAARAGTRTLARRPPRARGLCVDPVLFELSRCQEI